MIEAKSEIVNESIEDVSWKMKTFYQRSKRAAGGKVGEKKKKEK